MARTSEGRVLSERRRYSRIHRRRYAQPDYAEYAAWMFLMFGALAGVGLVLWLVR